MKRGRARYRADEGTRPFALFAECIVTGLWFSVAALPLVTAPAAAAAAARHLAAFLDGTPCAITDFLRDFAAAWRGAWRVGLATLAFAVVVVADLVVLASGRVPGGPLVAVVTVAAAAVACTVLLRAAAAWAPGARWRDLLVAAATAARTDLGGTGILLGGLLVLTACTWALWILFIPMSGCVVGAALAVHRRREATAAS